MAAVIGADAFLELLGLLASAELTACLRTAVEADRAPETGVQVALARMAVVEFGHYEQLAARLVELGQHPESSRTLVEQGMADEGQDDFALRTVKA
ncbi:MAG: ferritin-like domain-containing protein, partial [Actinomycetota bacterium]|nr:ferritin-like domain-containing protein [Actinomycetota bacterium]